MRIKPAALGLLLVGALCGATQPADEPSEPVVVAPPEAAVDPAPEAAVPDALDAPSPVAVPSEPVVVAPPEAAIEPVPEAPVADPQEAPSPAAEVPPPLEAAFDAAVSAPPSEAPVPDTPAPPAEGAAPAKGAPPTKEYFAGVWAEQGKSCDTAIDFKADGTMIGPFPRWELSEQGELTMVGNRQKITLTVIDQNTMQSRRSPTDPPRTLTRCVAQPKDGA